MILDFLCIHPFRDGNGRMSRLLSLLLYKNGFDAGKYVSFEEQINAYKAYYYITECLTDEEKTDLRIAYRGNRHDFTDSDAVKSLNSKLQTDYSFNNKILSLNLRENEIDSWDILST